MPLPSLVRLPGLPGLPKQARRHKLHKQTARVMGSEARDQPDNRGTSLVPNPREMTLVIKVHAKGIEEKDQAYNLPQQPLRYFRHRYLKPQRRPLNHLQPLNLPQRLRLLLHRLKLLQV